MIIFQKKQLLFIDFFPSTNFKFSISLISIITFNPWFLTLELICSFYHFLRWKLWLLNLIFVLLTCICKVKEAFFHKTWPSASSPPSVMAFAVWLSILVHERSQYHLEVVKDKTKSSQGMEFFLLEALSGYHNLKTSWRLSFPSPEINSTAWSHVLSNSDVSVAELVRKLWNQVKCFLFLFYYLLAEQSWTLSLDFLIYTMQLNYSTWGCKNQNQ